MTFNERVKRALQNSPVCVGLDSDYKLIPEFLKTDSNPVFKFNQWIINKTWDQVGAYKLNFAFYEALGASGWEILIKTCNHVRSLSSDIVLIADAKRGDIGNTADQYADAILYDLDFDCLTVNPYMGMDSVEPFIKNPRKGAFILCLTSNPGSKDIQYLVSDGKPVYMHVAEKVMAWNRNNNCGLVVGATHAEAMRHVRDFAKEIPFLIPGVGAQGGDLSETVKINYNGHYINAFINVSRSVIFASRENDFDEKAREAVLKIKNQITWTLR